MPNLIACALAVLLFSTANFVSSKTQSTRTKSNTPSAILPQAVPVYNLLKAIETNDFDLYRSVWSLEELKRSPERYDKRNWQETRASELEFFQTDGIKLNKLKFTFKGNASSEVVSVRRRGLQPVIYYVIKENGKWKLKIPAAKLDLSEFPTPPK
jgi:hypothetical protein